MNTNLIPASMVQEIGISYADARKAVKSMNLIDGFLFDSSIEDEEDAKVVIGAILSTVLTTHPDIEYKDGISHLYLYCNCKINECLPPSHGKRLMEVLKYIVSGEKTSTLNPEVNNLEAVVSKIKNRPEVTKKYMQQWDRERILIQEAKDEGTEIGKEIGKEQTLIGLICKKLLKGKSISVIASEVEEDEEYVKGIYSVAKKYIPDYDEEKVYYEWKQMSQSETSPVTQNESK